MTRLALIRAGLPAPHTQIEVRNAVGRVFARLDMGWPEWKVAVEYDGAQHWTDARQRAWDIDRWAELEAAGWSVIRVSGAMFARRDPIIDRVCSALRARGWPGGDSSVRIGTP